MPPRYPRKINVNLPLSGSLASFAREANAELSEHVNNFIDLSTRSNHSSHVTLYMGKVRTSQHITRIYEELTGYKEELSKLYLSSKGFSITDPDRHDNIYTFVDIEPESHIIEIKRRMCKSIARYFIEDRWFYLDEEPHVTIGCSSGVRAAEVRGVVSDFLIFKGAGEIASELRISDVGERGTCIGKICSYGLDGD